MGIFSILLGIVSFVAFIFGGIRLGSILRIVKDNLAQNIVSLATVSSTAVEIIVIVFFAFIGLLIGMNLIMHGMTYRKKQTGSSSLSMISILLGIIALCCFTMIGVYIANALVPYKELISMFPQMGFLKDASDALLYGIVIGLFAFIGVLICVNMVMHGLTYRKVSRLLKRR